MCSVPLFRWERHAGARARALVGAREKRDSTRSQNEVASKLAGHSGATAWRIGQETKRPGGVVGLWVGVGR